MVMMKRDITGANITNLKSLQGTFMFVVKYILAFNSGRDRKWEAEREWHAAKGHLQSGL